MNVRIATLLSSSLLLIALPTTAQTGPPAEQDTVVTMTACDKSRRVTPFFVQSSKRLVREGVIRVEGEDFRIYLPHPRTGYSIGPRTPSQASLAICSSTYLSVDQNHDGKLDFWESYYAELPLRIGDTMFKVTSIAKDGSRISLRRSKVPLRGAVIGRTAPDFAFKTLDGKTVNRETFRGATLIIDSWSPG